MAGNVTFDYGIGDVAPAAGNLLVNVLVTIASLATLIVLIAVYVFARKQFKK